MTLILTSVNSLGVIQVVDRLVTVQAPDQDVQPWDARSNKTILFSARDALCTISYSGLAYIAQLPTDQWIAQNLRREPLSLGRNDRPAAFTMGRVTNWPSIGPAIQRLVTDLELAMARLMPERLRSAPLSIVIAGWQLYRAKRRRTFGLIIEKLRDDAAVTIKRLPRHFGRGCALITEPEYLSSDEQNTLLNVIGPATADETEQAMIAEIRRVAEEAGLGRVGPHCMCVMLPPPDLGWARVRYDSPVPDVGYLVSSRGADPFPAAFTPWILTQDLTMAPAVHSGGCTTTQIGPWQLRIEGSPQESSLTVHSSQRRRGHP